MEEDKNEFGDPMTTKDDEDTGMNIKKKVVIIVSITVVVMVGIGLGIYFGIIKNNDKKDPPSEEIYTLNLTSEVIVKSSHYLSSGEIFVTYKNSSHVNEDNGTYSFGFVDDLGETFKEIYTGDVTPIYRSNGIRNLPFADNTRVLLGDFILECSNNSKLTDCKDPTIIPIFYPKIIFNSSHFILDVWSEPIVAPDNKHIAWTTLDDYHGAIDFVARIVKKSKETKECDGIPSFNERGFNSCYILENVQVISNSFTDGEYDNVTHAFTPAPIRGGELKQFVKGGLAVTQAGSSGIGLSKPTLQHLNDTEVYGLNNEPGYEETAILSPDEKMGISMSTRFSPKTNFAIVGLLPIPYSTFAASDLIKNAYVYSVTNVRKTGKGNIGPVLFDVEKSKNGYPEYRGINLHQEDGWSFSSPISWHYSSKKASFLEVDPQDKKRIRVVKLNKYTPQSKVEAKETPDNISYAKSVEQIDVIPPIDFDATIFGKDDMNSNLTLKFEPTEKTMIYNNFSIDGNNYFNGQLKSNTNFSSLGGSLEFNVTMTDKKGEVLGESIFKLKFESMSTVDWNQTFGYSKYKGIQINMDEYK